MFGWGKNDLNRDELQKLMFEQNLTLKDTTDINLKDSEIQEMIDRNLTIDEILKKITE